MEKQTQTNFIDLTVETNPVSISNSGTDKNVHSVKVKTELAETSDNFVSVINAF